MKLNKSITEKILFGIVLILSMTFSSIIFQDWENFKAGLEGTPMINTPINYHDIFTNSLIISLPIIFGFFTAKEKNRKTV
jgi:hypothetical protein